MTTTNGNPNTEKVKSNALVAQVGLATFGDYLKSRETAIGKVAASFIRPDRLTRVVLACVTRTPKLQQCTMQSILLSAMQSAELGLEPGSALGEAYLVPFKQTCSMIIGYRGLISLAFRSGHVKSIQAKEVCEGDVFEFELGLTPKLRHIPCGEIAPEKITHAWCVVHLMEGGVYFDVMTRAEIDRIRGRSRAANEGPWVTDYAEMCKKTVARRASKYIPMSVEMSKAFAADIAADTGDASALAEFDSIDVEFTAPEEGNGKAAQQKPAKGVEAVKEKLNAQAEEPTEAAPADPGEPEGLRDELLEKCQGLIDELFKKSPALRGPFVKGALGKDYEGDGKDVEGLSLGQLGQLIDALEARREQAGKAPAPA